MATWKYVESLSYAAPAAADLTGKLNQCMVVDASGNINVNAVNGGKVIGTLYEEAKINQPATVQFGGIVKVRTGAAVAAGVEVQSDGSGKAVTLTGTNKRLGVSLAAATGADQYIPVMII